MNSKYTLEQNVIAAYKRGKSVSLLITETGIPRSTIYAWPADERVENFEKETSFTLREYRNLENKVNRWGHHRHLAKSALHRDCAAGGPATRAR